jgi:outer membrane protein OmpA-like peptidoglycan-associated protein
MAKNWYKIGSGFDWLLPVGCVVVFAVALTSVLNESDALAEVSSSSSSSSSSSTSSTSTTVVLPVVTTVPPVVVPPTTVPPVVVPPATMPPVVTTVPPVVAPPAIASVPSAAVSPAVPVATVAPAPPIALPIRGAAPAKNQVTARVYFGLRSPVLTAEGKQTLKAAVQKVPKNKKFEVVIVGMVQNSDNVANVDPLSLGRAESVREYLQTLGIKGSYDVRIGGVVGETHVARRARATISYP